MANLSVAAGDNGVAGVANFATRTITGAYGTTYADNGNLAVSDNHAVRRSVAKTQRRFGGSAVAASGVFSETQGLRTAYVGVEVDSPALDASRTA
ncbi:hypothetical protein EBT31_14445 [bacterium]|nr:hypothetical protein [bacterium]